MRIAFRVVLSCIIGAGLVACSPPEAPAPASPPPAEAPTPAPPPPPLTASATIAPIAEVGIEGEVRFSEVDGFVRIEAEVRGLEDGLYGFHIHTGTDCDERGGHYDPTDRPHGSPDEPEHLRHVGDLGNLVSREGVARYYHIDPVVSLDGEYSVIGRITVVHHGEDKLLPQPAGDSGAQIGCGVIQTTRGS